METTLSRPAPIGLGVGDDLPLAGGTGQAALEAEHAGDGEAADVGVEHADGEALGRQGGGQVDRHRRLAHAALAGGDGQHPGVERAPPWAAPSRAACQRARPMACGLLLGVHLGPVDA